MEASLGAALRTSMYTLPTIRGSILSLVEDQFFCSLTGVGMLIRCSVDNVEGFERHVAD